MRGPRPKPRTGDEPSGPMAQAAAGLSPFGHRLTARSSVRPPAGAILNSNRESRARPPPLRNDSPVPVIPVRSIRRAGSNAHASTVAVHAILPIADASAKTSSPLRPSPRSGIRIRRNLAWFAGSKRRRRDLTTRRPVAAASATTASRHGRLHPQPRSSRHRRSVHIPHVRDWTRSCAYRRPES